MKTILSLFASLLICALSSQAQPVHAYGVAEKPWTESFGNHRAVLEIPQAARWVTLELNWRRHDPMPEVKQFFIIEAETGDTVEYINRISVDQEVCRLEFGPVMRPGTYYFYYLPYVVQEGWGHFHFGYLKEKEKGKRKKGKGEVGRKKGEVAEVVRIEARTAFDSFYPMEVIAVQREKDSLLAVYDDPMYIFPESRAFPIRMQDEIPHRWFVNGQSTEFRDTALKNEYFVFQIGVYAAHQDINNLRVVFPNRRPPVMSIQASANQAATVDPFVITCFNTEGVDPYGAPFTKNINIRKGGVQALWIGLDIPEDTPAGSYEGSFELKAQGVPTRSIIYTIEVLEEMIPDRGDSETWRHSRLRWLNSTAGLDDEPVLPYGPIVQTGQNKSKTSQFAIDWAPTGFPAQINRTDHILAAPIGLNLITNGGKFSFSYPVGELKKVTSGRLEWEQKWLNESIDVYLRKSLEFDGYQYYTASLIIKKPVTLEDVRLDLPFSPVLGTHMMGMGLPGGEVPDRHIVKWEKPEDSFWVGNAKGGLWCELRGSSYHGPLLNLYKPGHPEPWYNEGKGYLAMAKSQNLTLARVGTGKIELSPGDQWVFEFALLPTPVKDLDSKDQFTNRYYHSGGAPEGVEKEIEHGVKIVNIHHANQYNPWINYPFIAVNEMKGIVDQYHAEELKVKIYYTIRELTNHVTEIWALRSLGNEILGDGQGGGYPWLREHFVSNYTPQWYQHFPDESPDASILTAPQTSRWFNYYIEGLGWLVRNVDIDGLYLDDVSFDRNILKRMRKVMEQEKPGCIIDLHSNTGFSKGPAMQYAEFFPYVDKLWFGESFQYNKMPSDNWFVEVSGIPFGLMGDMLHGGGNRWLGMLFGMTVRLPWTSEGFTANPRPVWKFWDDYGIADSKMIGFWEPDCPVRLQAQEPVVSTDTKITVYIKPKQAIVAIGNFGETLQQVKLDINWNALNINPEAAKIMAPAIEGFQPKQYFKAGDSIAVPAKQGWLLVIE